MSQENVEVVRQLYRAMGEDVDRMLTYWDPRGDYYPVGKFPEAKPCHGPEEIRRFFVEYGLGLDQFEARIDAITPVCDDRVLVRGWLSFEGKTSGVKMEGEVFHCYWLRRGRVFRQEDHLTLAGALRALGLEGETFEDAGLAG